MKIGQQHYLVLEESSNTSHRIRFALDLKDPLLNWLPSTRISPVFAVLDLPATSPDVGLVENPECLVFIGPIHPEDLFVNCEIRPSAMWVGFGLLNVILSFPSDADLSRLFTFSTDRKLAIEQWKLKNGIAESITRGKNESVVSVGQRLARLSSRSVSPEVREALHEYCPLMASALARSYTLPQGLTDNLLRTHDFVEQAVKAAEENADLTPYRLLGQLLMVNAGLSRFSSQTFAGTPPITETECHFWTHSLLGIGIASIGLWKITDFLEGTLGQAKLPERFEKLESVQKEIPDLCLLDVNDQFWTSDHLDGPPENNGDSKPIIPLLSYFSARDGFRSTLTTISAPLASVASCNSPRWSLLTLTHEISHILVRGMLASVYPDIENAAAMDKAVALVEKVPGSTLLDEIARHLFITIIMMENVHSGQKGAREIDAEVLAKLLEHWHREVEEVFVHVFDFLYFYGKDVLKYINGIWASWGTIPNITTRIPDYVVRTITAVLAIHLRRPGGEIIARDMVVTGLRELETSGGGGSYVQQALTYLEKHWDDEVKPRVLARKGLVKIANTFFFSEEIATSVRAEPEISGGATEKEGYTLRTGQLELRPIRNPLRFLELYSTTLHPSPADSLWIYYILTFCVID